MTKRIMIISTVAMLAIAGFAFGFTRQENKCALEGKPECPKVNCPLKGTPLCPLEDVSKPACCQKK